MKPSEIPQAETQLIVPTYARPEMVFTHGEGVYLFDSDGNRYMDMVSGLSVMSLGHSDPEWVQAICDQAGKLTHITNLYHTEPHIELAKRLVDSSFADRVYFCNSGAEANEAALKFARKWAGKYHGSKKKQVIAFEQGFHGRTYGALSLTHKEKYRKPFAPLLPDITFLPFNKIEAAQKAIDETTCVVFVEPLQGEGGVNPAQADFLQALRTLCDENNALLVFDEVQCGLGRTGYLWAHEAYSVYPDIMTLAKPLAGGLPIGATLTTETVATSMGVGDHGSTFAAGPLVCRAAQVVFDRIARKEFLEDVRAKGEMVIRSLKGFSSDHIVDVRGAGLLIGIEFDQPVKPLVDAAREQGMLVVNAGENVLRLCPPLVISSSELEEGLAILSDCVGNL
jgi:predicted acetylornithine/succinylornithine family transaminase